MIGSLAARAAYKAISMGARIPMRKHIAAFDQQSRTIDEIRRRGVNLVLDVGANLGFYSHHLRMAGYTGHILAFEPEPSTFQKLAANTAGDTKLQIFDFALGSEAGELEFNVIRCGSGQETVLSSFLRPNLELGYETVRVKVVTLRELLPKVLPVAKPRIFLKMDTQGFDLNVFDGLGDVEPVRLLQSEVSVVPLYQGMPHYTQSLAHYEHAGFALLDMFVVNRTEDGGVLEYDCLFGR